MALIDEFKEEYRKVIARNIIPAEREIVLSSIRNAIADGKESVSIKISQLTNISLVKDWLINEGLIVDVYLYTFQGSKDSIVISGWAK